VTQRDATQGLRGLRVVAFESRRATEMAELIRRYGGEPLVAPSMREVPLSEHGAVFDYLRRLAAGEVDIVILMTGVGLRTLAAVVADEWPPERLAAALRRSTLVARGPKPVAALRELGVQPAITVAEPNTWREILATLDAQLPVAGKRVAVQEYGVTNRELIDGLSARGAEVLRVPIYRWALPDDLGPLHEAVGAICEARIDIALFTSATQVYHLFQVASADADRLRVGFATVLIASIGPVCSQALREQGLEPDLEPAHAKMGQLVREVALRGQSLLARKRSGRNAPA
jgi:uroporphyrinogen-III synthase